MSDETPMPDTSPPPDNRPGRSAQPDIIQLQSLATSTAQEIDSDILNPVVFSSDNLFARFELEPKGFMSPGSTISIGLKPNSGVDRAFVPLGVGVNSLISRAVLRTSSGRVINDTTDYPFICQQKSMAISSEVQKNRELYTTGRGLCYEMNYVTDSATGDLQRTSAQSYGLDNGKTYDSDAGLTSNNFSVISKDRMDLSPTYQVALHSLFPFLKAGNNLPLFMFGDDRIQIELYFTPTIGKRVSLSYGDRATADTSAFLIDENSLQLISDHIFYPGAMDEWASKNSDLTFGYVDYQTSRHNLTTTTAKNNTRNVGGAGRLVTRVFCGAHAVHDGTAPVKPANDLLNEYGASANMRNHANQDQYGNNTTNLLYNERYLYPLDVKNNARHYHQLKDAEGKILYTTRCVYSNEGGSHRDTAGSCVIAPSGLEELQFEGKGQSNNLSGKQYFMGWRLNRGERVGTKGIEIKNDYSDLRELNGEEGQYIQVSWIEVLRTARLKDGQMEVFYA